MPARPPAPAPSADAPAPKAEAPAPEAPKADAAARARAAARAGARAEGRRRPGQGEPARPPPRRAAGDRPCRPHRLRPGRPDRQGRRRRRRRQGACRGRGRCRAPARAAAGPSVETDIPHEAIKLSNMRKTIARRLTEAKQTIPHIYLTVDIRLDALLKLRGELNKGLESRGVKLSVNDMLIKALAVALIEVPECNVSISGRPSAQIQPRRHFGGGVDPGRADHADHRRRRQPRALSAISKEMTRARRPRQGGQAAAARISGRDGVASRTWACTGSSSSTR